MVVPDWQGSVGKAGCGGGWCQWKCCDVTVVMLTVAVLKFAGAVMTMLMILIAAGAYSCSAESGTGDGDEGVLW